MSPLGSSAPTSEGHSRFSAFSMEKRESSITPEKRKIQSSQIILYVSSAASLAFLGTLSSFIILDFWVLSADIQSSKSTALAAAILDPTGLLALVLLIIFSLASSDQGWLKRVILPLTGALIAVAGACMSLSAILIKKTNAKKGHAKDSDNPGSTIPFPVEVALWIMSVVSQLVFYTVVLIGRPSSDGRQGRLSFVQSRRTTPAPARPPTPPTPLRLVAPPYALPQASTPFVAEAETKERRSSWRDSLHSLHQVVRPMNSRTRLLGQRSSISRDSSMSQKSDSRSIATTTHSDGFETWDTSALDAQLREQNAIAFPTQPGKTALEPIPGSRPVSPARALDGPFHFDSTPTQSTSNLHSQLERIDRPPTDLSFHSRIERPPTAYSHTSHRSANTTANTTSRTSRPTSPEIPPPSEAHIHPLFRTDSPVPPPAATPGTTITASPYSGHVITVPSTRSRASSRARRAPSPSITGNGSRSASPAVTRNRSPEDISPISGRSRSRSRSSSMGAPSRAMTPPIPEFILSASRERII
jgi:hypothetical protein